MTGLKQDALSLRKYLVPLRPRVEKLQADLQEKEEAAAARITEADRIVAYCEKLQRELAGAKHEASMQLQAVTGGSCSSLCMIRRQQRLASWLHLQTCRKANT